MRILYFSPRECWPLTTGARLRDYHLARQLARHAEVTYFGLRPHDERGEAVAPAPDGFAEMTIVDRAPAYSPANLLRGLIGPDPVTVLNYWSTWAAEQLRRILRERNYDSVQMEGVHLVRYLPVIRAAAPATAVIADWHNIESEILARYAVTNENAARRLFARRTASLVERAESTLLRDCDHHTVASDRERETLQLRSPRAALETIPNGVDVSFYATEAHTEPRCDILFVGSMDYHANIDGALWMAREAWPRVRAAAPKLRLTIVGRKPTPAVQALACEDIVVTGTVDDVRPYYARALAVVVPLRVGSGTRLKILEAMAAGVPVISTRLGAEGLRVEDGTNVVLADTAEELALQVCRVASNPELRARLRSGGLDLVTRLYDWARLGTQLRAVHDSAVARKRSKGGA